MEQTNKTPAVRHIIHEMRNKLAHVATYLYTSKCWAPSEEDKEICEIAESGYRDFQRLIDELDDLFPKE